MTEDVSAGRLYVDVEGDTTGFGRDLQRKVDAAVANVKARVQAEVDARRLQADLNRAVRTTRATINVPVTVDRAQLARDLKAAVLAAQRTAGKVTISVDADVAAAEADIDRAARDRKATIEVDADTAAAEAEAEVAKRRISRTPAKIRADFDASSLLAGSAAIAKFMMFPAIADGIQLAVGAIGQLGAGLIALTSAAGPAVNLLGLIPAAGSAIIGGLAPVVASFLGVGKAVKAMDASQKTATSSSNTLAAAQEAAARRVVAAQRALRNTYQQTAESRITAAEDVQHAEQALARSQRDAVDAQAALSQARAEATQRLKDYEDQLADAALNERGAQIAVERAQQALDKVNRSATSTSLDRREAQLAYDEALQRQKELSEHDDQLRKQAEAAQKAGVEGDSQVVEAKRKVDDATQNVLDQEQALADARRKQANEQRDALQQIRAAREELAYAIEAQGKAEQRQTSAASAEAAAMAQLSPAGQRFARFLHNVFVPRLREVQAAAQEAFLPPLQRGLTAAMRLLPNLDRLMTSTGGVMGSVAEKALKMVSSGPWRRDFDTITGSVTRTLRSLGGALNPILTVIRDLALAGGPFIERFAKILEHGAKALSTFVGAQRGLGEAHPGQGLDGFFGRAAHAAGQLWTLIKNLGGALANIGKAAGPAGQILLDDLNAAVKHLRDITGSTSGQNSMQKYFLDAVPGVEAMGRLLDGIVKVFIDLGRNNSIAPLLDQITNKLLPALTTALQQMGSAFGPAFVRLLTDVVKLFGDLGGGSGGLTAAANALDAVAKALDYVLHLPGMSAFIGGILSIGGAATGIGLVAGAFGKIGEKLGKIISKVPGAKKVFDKLKSAIGLSTGEIDKELPKDKEKGKALSEVEDKGGKAAKTLGGKLVGAARAAGGALAGAAKAAWGFVAAIVKAGVEAAVAGAKFLWAKVQALAMEAAQLAQAAAAKIVTAAQVALDVAMDANPIGLVILAVAALAAGLVVLWTRSETFRRIVTEAFNAVWGAVKDVWNWIKANWPLLLAMLTGPIGAATLFIARHWDAIKGYFRDAISWIEGVWRTFWNGLSSIGSSIFRNIYDGIETILGYIKTGFQRAVDSIALIWRGLEAAAKAPVSFVVNTVYMKGIRWAWNKVADLVHLPELPEAKFAKGGTVPGYAPGRDSVRAWLSPGEGVLVPETVRGLGGPAAIDSLNATFSSRVTGPTIEAGAPAFKGGGVLDRIKDTASTVGGAIKGAGGAILDGVGYVSSKVLQLIRTAAADAISGLLGPVRGWLESMRDGSPWSGALAAMFENLINAVVNRIKGATAEHHSDGGVVSGAPSTQDKVPAWLRPGEGILTPSATQTLGGAAGIAALNHDPIGALLAAARAAGASAPIVIDRHVVFEDGAIRVENPEPEPASTSINTRMRALAGAGVFG